MTIVVGAMRRAPRGTPPPAASAFSPARCASLLVLVLIVLILAAEGVRAADDDLFYPDDHWSYSTQIKDREAFDAHVRSEIEAGRTLFVRWIASTGC